jgi:hypothetical protein
MNEPNEIVTGDGFHCTNPRIIATQGFDDDSLFYLFYESDQNGNSDIFYQVYTTNGFTEPALLAGTPENETHLRCNNYGMMSWQEGDKIKAAYLDIYNPPLTITEPVDLDSGNCSMPDVSVGYYDIYVAWVKQEGDSSFIYKDYWNGSFQEPERVVGAPEISSLKFASGTCFDEAPVLSWEKIENGIHTIQAVSLWDTFNRFTGEFQQESAFSPSMSIYYVPVETFYESGNLTFVYGAGQANDVYINSDDFTIMEQIDSYRNISQSPNEEANPAIFQGEFTGYPYRDMFIIWESMRNDHWQLFYSYKSFFCGGGINEQPVASINGLNIFPNPVKNTCDISYMLEERSAVSIAICSPDGKQVSLQDNIIQEKGGHSYHLDFSQLFPGNIYTGLYLVKVQAGNSSVSQKVIRIY